MDAPDGLPRETQDATRADARPGGFDAGPDAGPAGAGVLVRYWAGAKAAAGVSEEILPAPITVADLLKEVVRRHRGHSPRMPDVVSVCSILVGEQPLGRADPATVVLQPGDTVELLPPFAGG